MLISKAEAAKRLLAEAPMDEYRIVVQKRVNGKWEKVFAMHGDAADENVALQRAATARNHHPAFAPKNDYPEVDKGAKNWRNDANGVYYPNISVALGTQKRNAFEIIGRVRLALKLSGVPMPEVGKFSKEATGSRLDKKVNSVEETMSIVRQWVNVS